MCTVTVKLAKDGYLVTMNRDESTEREKEIPPVNKKNISYPVDGKFGGTWFALDKENQKTFCLMNRYDKIDSKNLYKTRGEIPIKLAQGDKIENLALNEYKPFTLIEISKSKIVEHNFDGTEIKSKNHVKDGWHFFSSSSWKSDEVIKWRRDKFYKWQNSPRFVKNIPSYNLLQEKDFEDFSPLVKRDKTITTSITQSKCNFIDNKSQISYFPDPSAVTIL